MLVVVVLEGFVDEDELPSCRLRAEPAAGGADSRQDRFSAAARRPGRHHAAGPADGRPSAARLHGLGRRSSAGPLAARMSTLRTGAD